MSSSHPVASQISQQRLTGLLRVFVALVTIAVFYPVVHFDFVDWDDNLHIYTNPHFQPVTWKHLLAFWYTPHKQVFMPLTYTIWGALVWVTQLLTNGPLTAEPFHALNLLLHVGSVLMLYQIGLCLFRLEKSHPDWQTLGAAAVAALAFGLHPLQIEAFAWASSLKDVLCGCLALMAVWQYLAYVQAPQRQRRSHYRLATGAFVLALLAKSTAVVVPMVAGFLAIVGLGQPGGRTLRSLRVWLLIALAWGVWAKVHQPNLDGQFMAPLWARPMIAADALTFYLGKLVWPVGLNIDYGRTPQVVLERGWGGYLTLLVPLALGGVLWWCRRYGWGLTVALGVLTICLLPVLGFVPFVFQNHSTVADRYVYLALLGPALGLGWVVRQSGPYRTVWVFSGLALALLGWRSMDHLPVWQNITTLFTHALQVNPNSDVAHNNLGVRLYRQGKIEQAIYHYQQLLQIGDTSSTAYYNLAQALLVKGQFDAAVDHYTKALQLKPDWPQAHNNLGSALLKQGKIDAAIPHYRQAIQLQPDWVMPYNNLGIALTQQGNVDAAMALFSQATDMAPTFAYAPYNLGKILQQQGRIAEAIATFRQALQRRPDWPEVSNELAWLLISQLTPLDQDLSEAVVLAEYACRATHYLDPASLYTLAVAYEATGQWPTAQATARRALNVAKTLGDTARLAQIQEWLQRQRSATPTP